MFKNRGGYIINILYHPTIRHASGPAQIPLAIINIMHPKIIAYSLSPPLPSPPLPSPSARDILFPDIVSTATLQTSVIMYVIGIRLVSSYFVVMCLHNWSLYVCVCGLASLPPPSLSLSFPHLPHRSPLPHDILWIVIPLL